MKKLFITVIMAILTLHGPPVLCAGPVKRETGDARKFEFKFREGRTITYAVKIGMDMNMAVKAAGRTANIGLKLEIRTNLALTPTGKSKSGVTTVDVKSSGLEADWIINSPDGRMDLALRGDHMIGRKGGVTIIDTRKGIGGDLAKQFNKQIDPIKKSGRMDINTQGKVVKLRGDPDFVNFWADTFQSNQGLFGIVFPDREIAVGETWRHSVPFKKMGDMALRGRDMNLEMATTRRSDQVIRGRTLSSFAVNAVLKLKDVTAQMKQQGVLTKMVFENLDLNATGTVRFEPEKNRMVDQIFKLTGRGRMKMEVGLDTIEADLSMTALQKLWMLHDRPVGGR